MPAWIDALTELPVLFTILQLALIWLIALVGRAVLRLTTRQLQRRLEANTKDGDRVARLNTLLQAGHGLVRILILVLALLMSLQVIGIDIGPLLAGAGLAGLALSLGAQSLFKDLIGGVLILIENQFKVGEVIRVEDVTGTVERITLRATYLRSLDGNLHLVPNGDMRLVSNLTRDWARSLVELHVAFDSDLATVMAALEEAARRAQDDERIKAHLLEAPQPYGWVGFNEWGARVRLMAKTVPGKQWEVSNAMRRHALDALQAAGVRVALPAQQLRIERK